MIQRFFHSRQNLAPYLRQYPTLFLTFLVIFALCSVFVHAQSEQHIYVLTNSESSIRFLQYDLPFTRLETDAITQQNLITLRYFVVEKPIDKYAIVDSAYKYVSLQADKQFDPHKTIIHFNVSREWITQQGINYSSIQLRFYDSAWFEAPTVMENFDDVYYSYFAVVPKFTHYVITFEQAPVPVSVPENITEPVVEKKQNYENASVVVYPSTEEQLLAKEQADWLSLLLIGGGIAGLGIVSIYYTYGQFMKKWQDRPRPSKTVTNLKEKYQQNKPGSVILPKRKVEAFANPETMYEQEEAYEQGKGVPSSGKATLMQQAHDAQMNEENQLHSSDPLVQELETKIASIEPHIVLRYIEYATSMELGYESIKDNLIAHGISLAVIEKAYEMFIHKQKPE